MNRSILAAAIVSSIMISCGNNSVNQKNNSSENLRNNDTISGKIIKSAVKDISSIQTYWDNINFSDFDHIQKSEEVEQKFVDFIYQFTNSDTKDIASAIKNLIEHASSNENTLKYFEDLMKKYLYDVNSPFYNENFYKIAVEQLIQSTNISENSVKKYKVLLEIMNKNNVGEIATDFSFYSNNKRINLKDLKSEFIILFFYDTSCPVCNTVIEQLSNSNEFNNLISSNITMLAIYPDGIKSKWEDYSTKVPKNWTNGIDLDQKILRNRLYDLKASPTIYLLDRDKKVLLKDADINEVFSYLKDLKK